MLTRRSFAGSLLTAPLLAATATDPADMTVAEAIALLRQRKLTPVELAEACLKRVERLNPRLNALITVTREQALARARSLRPSSSSSQPLHGIPIVVKDLFDTAAVRTTAGSAQWRERVPNSDARVVERLRDAGSVLIGKANMDEFAYNFTSETSHFGASRNPWNPQCSPGGSSGGSAIAVATGMCLAAIGSDTGGSIRLPASFCGITGYKPTYGLISTEGAAPLAWSLDHVGPMTRTVGDAASLHGVLSGRPVPSRPVKDLRVGIVRIPYWQRSDSEVDRALSAGVETIRRLCRVVRDVQLPELPNLGEIPLPTTYGTLIFAEAYAFHRDMLARNPGRYHPGTKASIELGKSVTAADYIAAKREMERLRATAATLLFKDVDLLLTPTAPGPAFKLGAQPNLVFLANTAPWNLYGLPTISIPCGFTQSGLPIGLQITGVPNGDGTVFSLAEAFQSATDFHRRRPSV